MLDKGKEALLEYYYREKNKIEEEIEQLIEMKKHCLFLREEFVDIQYYRKKIIERIDMECSDCRTAEKYCEGMTAYLFENEYIDKLRCFDRMEQKISSKMQQLLFRLDTCRRRITEINMHKEVSSDG